MAAPKEENPDGVIEVPLTRICKCKNPVPWQNTGTCLICAKTIGIEKPEAPEISDEEFNKAIGHRSRTYFGKGVKGKPKDNHPWRRK